MTDTSLKQKCSVWYHVWGGVVVVACMVVVFMVVVCGSAWIMVRVINEKHPASQPADIDVVQELIDRINYSLLYGEYELNTATTEELIENIRMLQ